MPIIALYLGVPKLVDMPRLSPSSQPGVGIELPVRVLLVDDYVMFRQGLKILLQHHGLNVVGEAGNGTEAVELARRCLPDVVVMDMSMPVMNGIDAALRIRRELEIPTILLTVHAEEPAILRAFEVGVAGYVLKSNAATELIRAIREVNQGHIYLSPGISRKVVREMLCRDFGSGADFAGAADIAI